MQEIYENPAQGGAIRLNLDTLEDSRKTYCRLIRLRGRNKIEDAKYKSLIYGMTGLLGFWKLEKELDIERRLESIEAALQIAEGSK